MRNCIQFSNAIYKYTICRYTIYARDAGDKAISESHKYIDLISVDSSSVDFFSLIANALFLILPRLIAS